VVGSVVAAAGGGDRRVTRAAEAEADGGGGQGVRHEEQQGQGLFVLKCGFGLPVWRVLPAWVRLLFVRFAGGAVRLAACAFCWPKEKSGNNNNNSSSSIIHQQPQSQRRVNRNARLHLQRPVFNAPK